MLQPITDKENLIDFIYNRILKSKYSGSDNVFVLTTDKPIDDELVKYLKSKQISYYCDILIGNNEIYDKNYGYEHNNVIYCGYNCRPDIYFNNFRNTTYIEFYYLFENTVNINYNNLQSTYRAIKSGFHTYSDLQAQNNYYYTICY
jgi:hypothetical protein